MFEIWIITIAKFEGNEIGEEFEKKDLEGNLEEQIKAADTVLNLYLKTRVKIKGFENEQKPEIPKEVLRELVVNAVAHRVQNGIRLLYPIWQRWAI